MHKMLRQDLFGDQLGTDLANSKQTRRASKLQRNKSNQSEIGEKEYEEQITDCDSCAGDGGGS